MRGKNETTISRRFLRRARRQPGAAILVCLFTAAAIGVPLNALYFQDGRHPAPLFRSVTVALEPNAATPARVVPARVPLPPARPAAVAQTSVPAAKPVAARSDAVRSGDDPIARLLEREEPESDASHKSSQSVLTAQRALIELGYLPRADGRLGAVTRLAIEKFERDVGLPAKGFLTPEVLRFLSARATAVERARGALQ